MPRIYWIDLVCCGLHCAPVILGFFLPPVPSGLDPFVPVRNLSTRRHPPTGVANMCGIIGSWHPHGKHPALEAGLGAIAHRGPDGYGWQTCGNVLLGHRRLSIVDVAGGRQPLCCEDGRFWMVHNGEIYNHVAILQDLRMPHAPRTRSDGEAWLHAAQELGMAHAVRPPLRVLESSSLLWCQSPSDPGPTRKGNQPHVQDPSPDPKTP